MTSQLKIKVCGMRDPENIQQLIKLKPDFIGFVLFPGSRRFVGSKYVLETEIPETIKKTGVFVNAVLSEVIHWVHRLHLDVVQLHGSEPPEYCEEIRNLGIKIIKSFGVDHNFDFSVLEEFTPYCDYFLFDTLSVIHGGSGIKFDWTVLKSYKEDTPVILSGGLGIEDIDAIKNLSFTNFVVVDINSRFEISPGLKNINLVDEFLKRIRSKI
jgi:phosphoribosylanthranilate isomerase